MKQTFAICLATILATSYASGAAPLTNAVAIARIIADRQQFDSDFDLRAQDVSVSSDSSLALTVKDDSGFVRIYSSYNPQPVPSPGDWLSIQGGFCNLIEDVLIAYATNLTVIAHAPPPSPVDATPDDIYSGKLAYSIVRLHGIVIDAFQDEADARFSFLVLSVDGKPIGLPAAGKVVPYERLKRLIGAEIAVVGHCSPYYGHGPRAKLEYEVYIEREDDITVITPPPADPFEADGFQHGIYPILFPKPGDTMRRKLFGRVEAVTDNRVVYVRTANGELSSVRLTSGCEPPAPNDLIEAVGIAETDFYSFILSRASWRPATAAPVIAAVDPESRTIQDIFLDPDRPSRFNDKLVGRLLRIRGQVVDLVRKGDGRGLVLLRDGDHNLTVDATAVPHALDRLEEKCLVEITGLCVADTDTWRPQSPFPHINGMSLVLRTPEDVTVLARSPWWTPARLQFAILILFGVIVVFIVYSLILTRSIRRRDEDLNRERRIHERADVRRFERTRLAIELHDSLVQILTGAAMEMETSRKIGVSDPAAMSAHLGIAEKALQSCREELRNSIWDLRSDALEKETLEGAILRTLTPHVNKARVAVKFAVPREILSDNVCHTVIRIIRELTLNAATHGHAQLVRVAGKAEDGTLYFSVIDNGCGFDVDHRPGVLEGHFGLQGVKERVNALNGTFSIASSPGHGTKVRVTIPLEATMI